MIHQYKQNGYNIVLDSLSGSVHAVDEVAYDIIGMYETTEKTQGTGGDEVRTVLWHFIFSCGLRETVERDNRAV